MFPAGTRSGVPLLASARAIAFLIADWFRLGGSALLITQSQPTRFCLTVKTSACSWI
jgi:hypothetical protein